MYKRSSHVVAARQQEESAIRLLTPEIRRVMGDQASALTAFYQNDVYAPIQHFQVYVYDHLGAVMWPPLGSDEEWLNLVEQIRLELGGVMFRALSRRPHYTYLQ